MLFTLLPDAMICLRTIRGGQYNIIASCHTRCKFFLLQADILLPILRLQCLKFCTDIRCHHRNPGSKTQQCRRPAQCNDTCAHHQHPIFRNIYKKWKISLLLFHRITPFSTPVPVHPDTHASHRCLHDPARQTASSGTLLQLSAPPHRPADDRLPVQTASHERFFPSAS